MNAIKQLGLLFFCLLTACTPSQQLTSGFATHKIVPLEKRKAQAANLSSWEIHGAIAAKTKSKGWSAIMNWAQHGAEFYQIRLMGPLGGGAVIITKKGDTITFQEGSKVTKSNNAEQMLLKHTGIKLPVSNLYYWIRGLPAPGTVQAEHYDQFNHLVQLKQSGFSINFSQYIFIKGIDLPSAVRLEGNGLMIKVIIKKWSISQAIITRQLI